MTAATSSMSDLDAHRRAQVVFATVLQGVARGQLEAATPCAEWNVGQLISHVIGGNQRVAGAEAALPDDPAGLAEAHRASADTAQAVFEGPDGMSRIFKVRAGDIPGAVFIRLRTTDVLTHGWDLARATGQATGLDPDLAERMLDICRTLIRPEFRGAGRAFAAEKPCDADHPPIDRLAAFLGRSVA
jgi:uncharacterized protein (TIGR03086 family)